MSPCRAAFEGTITFDGQGNYQLAGQGVTPNSTTYQGPLKAAVSGTYSVLSSGAIHLSNPFDAAGKASLAGGIGQGGSAIVAASSGQNYWDLFIAIPAGTVSGSAALTGKYYVAGLGYPSAAFASPHGDLYSSESTFYSMAADGKGGLGSISIPDTTPLTTTASYDVAADGSGVIHLPSSGLVSPNQLLAGDKQMYVSPDGSFFMAGGASSYEMIFGVRAPSGSASNSSLGGTYFLGQLLDNPYGTFSDAGAVTEIPSLKAEVGDYYETSITGDYDLSFEQNFAFDADGTRTTSDKHWAIGAGGMFVIGAGQNDVSSVSLRIKAPTMTGSGVFLNPQGVVNAANNAPFTGNVAPGELITLYGSGLAPQTVVATTAPWSTTLGGVQVLIGGFPAPLYFVSDQQISAVVPFGFPTDSSLQDVQVINNSSPSNIVKVTARKTSPGIFTIPAGGIGDGAILHAADYSVVSLSNPAKSGETVVVFLTGLGSVAPPVADGVAGPFDPPSNVTDASLAVYVGGQKAAVAFAGLAPTLIGLYQLNLTLPNGLAAGEAPIEIDTIDGTTVMATIAIGN